MARNNTGFWNKNIFFHVIKRTDSFLWVLKNSHLEGNPWEVRGRRNPSTVESRLSFWENMALRKESWAGSEALGLWWPLSTGVNGLSGLPRTFPVGLRELPSSSLILSAGRSRPWAKWGDWSAIRGMILNHTPNFPGLLFSLVWNDQDGLDGKDPGRPEKWLYPPVNFFPFPFFLRQPWKILADDFSFIFVLYF